MNTGFPAKSNRNWVINNLYAFKQAAESPEGRGEREKDWGIRKQEEELEGEWVKEKEA